MSHAALSVLGIMFVGSILANLALPSTFSGAVPGFSAGPTTITLSGGGITVNAANSCNNPLAGIPVLSNIFAFFSYLGSVAGGNPNTACQNQAGAIVTMTYDPSQPFNYANLFLGVIAVVIAGVVLSGITIVGTGLNTGAVFTVFLGGSLMMIWLLVGTAPLLILATVPANYGLYFYGALTLVYAVDTIKTVGGIRE